MISYGGLSTDQSGYYDMPASSFVVIRKYYWKIKLRCDWSIYSERSIPEKMTGLRGRGVKTLRSVSNSAASQRSGVVSNLVNFLQISLLSHVADEVF